MGSGALLSLAVIYAIVSSICSPAPMLQRAAGACLRLG